MPFAQSKPSGGGLPDPITTPVNIATVAQPADTGALKVKPSGTDAYGIVLDVSGNTSSGVMIVLPEHGDPGADLWRYQLNTNGVTTSVGAFVASPDGNTTAFAADTTNGAQVSFYGAAPIAKQTGVAVTAAAIHAALVELGLISA
jgi:hypothetical protein